MRRALDLCCCAGGATKGLQTAGYHVTGVDIKRSPRYCGDAFILGDALEVGLDGYDLIWASPPCQRYSATASIHGNGDSYPDLVDPIRKRLVQVDVPYIIENVVGAPLINPLMLCGTMFNLLVIRHRLFETNPPIYFPPATCAHQRKSIAVGRMPDREKNYITIAGHFADMEFAKEAMGIDWMNREELAEAIPPAYSYFLATEIDKWR